MTLRCKVFRAAEAGLLEADINRFLAGDTGETDGDLQLEEITQSEGPGGVTVTLWYALGAPAHDIADEIDVIEPEMLDRSEMA